MPTYQMDKTYKSGFYDNWKDVNGKDMRVYSAQDMRKPYDVVFSDGVMPEADGTAGNMLKVSWLADMEISIAKGYAKVGGAWFENIAPYKIILDAAESTTRYDCIIVRNDDTEKVAESSIYIKSLYSVPTVANLVRNNTIYEICLACVEVPAFAENITAENIIDTRTDGNLCNVMRGVGATVVRTYQNTYFTESENQTEVPIGISQFDRTRDALAVMVEGRIMTAGTNYNIIDNATVAFEIGFPIIGTKIDFEVIKNVNAAGAETVIQETAQLRKEMTAANKVLEHHYYCNGSTDNINISQLAQTFINGGTDYRSMRLVIHGNVGAVAPYAGTGTNQDNFLWFALGKNGESTSRRFIVDFSDCTAITLPITEGTYNTVFSGNDAHVIGANVIANQSAAGTYIRIFNSASGVVFAENCRFWITANITSYISQTGTFKNCRGSVTCNGANAYCFYPTANALLRVEGGEYYAYTTSTYVSAVVYQTAETAVAILYGVNCPTVSRSGYVQSYAVNASGASISMTDTITALPVNVPNGNIRGILAISKAGMM